MKSKNETNTYNEMFRLMHNSVNSVEINAKKNHHLILKVLSDINRKLDELEKDHFYLKSNYSI